MVLQSSWPSVPVETALLHEKVLSALRKHAELHPKNAALIMADDPEQMITYGQLRSRIFSISSFLSQKGVGYQDMVCQVLPNGIEFCIAYLAALNCGAAMSAASAMFTDYELERQFIDSKCKAVITDGTHLEKVLQATKNCPLVKVIICVDPPSDLPLSPKVCSWVEAASTSAAGVPPFPRNVDDVAILPYSSGTTGSPKGVMLTHKNIGTMMNILIEHQQTVVVPKMKDDHEEWDWSKQHVLLYLPFYHMYGFGLLNMALLQGSAGIIMSQFDPFLFLGSLEKYRIKQLMLVPPLALFMVRNEIVNNFELSFIKIIMTGAAPLGKELCEEFYLKFKNVRYLAQGYGMTECSMASNLPLYDRRDNYITVGSLVANVEEKIVDPATGKEVPTGERGEICVRGPTVMKGYLNRPEATAETIDKEGWLHTGDVGYLNEKGETFIVDRMKELIKVKGLQVPPAELEDLLHGHPGIADVAVIGIPDARTGEKPKAFVVKSDPSLTEEAVTSFVESKVSSYKWLAGGVEFIDEIPKSPSGKILRRLLRDESTQSKI